MFDNSPADENDRPFTAIDANDADPDPEDTFPVPYGYAWTDVHGIRHVVGEGWVNGS